MFSTNYRRILSPLSGLLLLVFSASVFAQALPDFTELVENSAPAIVNISTRNVVQGSQRFEDLEDMEDFEEFLRLFGDRLPEGFDMRERPGASLGSGFIISEDGYIVTNHHVIDGADEITVTLNDQRQFNAEIIGSDARSDLALLKISGEGLPTVAFGDASEVKVGQWVLAIGSPFNLSHSVAAGIVSFVGRSLPQFNGQGNYVSFLQTDVAINPGHSGGPLFNLDGEVIGVNSQIYSNSGGSIGLSFAIPVDVAANVIDQIMMNGTVARGWMGVSIANLTQEQADEYNLATPRGAFVNSVLPGGPAEEAGFQSEDIIVTYDGDIIRNSADLPYHVGLTLPGTEVEIGVVRNGELQTIRMIVGDLDSTSTQQQIQLGSLESLESSMGMSLSQIDEGELDELGLEYGLQVDSVDGSIAEQAGLQAGDILLSMNNRPLRSLQEFVEISGQLPTETPIPLLVERGGEQSYFTMRLEN
ncbi:MAG: serine peptidase [Gammaproteobacteria bacterium]|nr:serine peptidase [Gammaproteobacteria bacterium]|tara:strand:- start:3319 stop:4740 length:1422 start_codon:yes stop_codon:yes gene_type:complete